MPVRISRKCLRKKTILWAAIFFFTTFNIIGSVFRKMPEETSNTASITFEQKLSNATSYTIHRIIHSAVSLTVNSIANRILYHPANHTTDHIVDPNVNLTVDLNANLIDNHTINAAPNPTVNLTENPVVNHTVNLAFNVTVDPIGNITVSPIVDLTINSVGNRTVNPAPNLIVNLTDNPMVNYTVNLAVNVTVDSIGNLTTSSIANLTAISIDNRTMNPALNPVVNPTVNLTKNPMVNLILNRILNPTGNLTGNPKFNYILNQILSHTASRTVHPIVDHTLGYEPSTNVIIKYYESMTDKRYSYEFRFEYSNDSANDDPRLMILLNGNQRTCVDYWEFYVGRRILATLRRFRFLILAICSKRRSFHPEGPVENNPDAKWIYSFLQKWMNEVYFKQFQRYPRLYLHGISRGSKFAALFSRVLPIQGQILTIFPGHWQGLLARSDHSIEMQTRLQLDPVFANWFYFDFCYNKKSNQLNISERCPFQSNRKYYQPVSPIYFVHPKKDLHFKLSDYTSMIDGIRQDAFHLGGTLLSNSQTITLYILPPAQATPTYMQEMFDMWRLKPQASSIFYDHYINFKQYRPYNRTRRTCLCLNTDFRYFELHPEITQTWSKQKQEEYRDYANDVRVYEKWFCEEACGDLHADHAIISRDLDKALNWLFTTDDLRHSLYIADYLARPLRIWMYEKSLVTTKTNYFSSNEPNYINISKPYRMYSPEYYLQDYFQQLKTSSPFSRHNLQWATDPLLADYFIIPSDLTYYYFYPDVNAMAKEDFQRLVNRLNFDYFNTLLRNIRNDFPFWTIAASADQVGSNHVLTILTGRNMGIFFNYLQRLLKNVIQMVFTGLRQDMLPPDAPPARDYRGTIIVYRHGYDVVIPQFIRVKPSSNLLLNLSAIVKQKKRLFFFAGSLDHTMTAQSARPLLRSVWTDLDKEHKDNMTTQIEEKQFDTLTIIEGHQKPDEYIESIQSSVFSLCPEGFFPWSPRFYEAMQIGAIPLILADNIVLPFERFIDWPSISAKINVSNIKNITSYVHRIDNFEQYIEGKLSNTLPYMQAFQWPYTVVEENGQNTHVFLTDEDRNGSSRNVLHYISMELRCRRLEQLYGLTSDSFSTRSLRAQQRTCQTHPTVCPCHTAQQSVAFREFT